MIHKTFFNIEEIFQLALQNQNKKNFFEAKQLYKKVLELNPKIKEAEFNLGVIHEILSENEEAVKCYQRVLNTDPKHIFTYNNLGLIFNKLGKYRTSINYFNKAISLNPNYVNAYNNLGNNYLDQGKHKEAFKNYLYALKIDKKNENAIYNLVTLLSHYLPNSQHSIVLTNNNLRKLRQNLDLTKIIESKKALGNFFSKANQLKNSNKILKNLNFIDTQIYRKNTFNLNCDRHHTIFKQKNIIPNFCFGCFKIQIEPKDVLNLMRLYLIFDNFNFPNNNWRKCFIELRHQMPGAYKGLIYCSSLREAEEIIKDLFPILNKYLKFKYSIKRGCSEFYRSFPNFKNIKETEKNFMNYDKKWRIEELEMDSKLNSKKYTLTNSVVGLTIHDILTINQWANYANMIGDQSYNDIGLKFTHSNYITYKIKDQKDFRIKQLLC